MRKSKIKFNLVDALLLLILAAAVVVLLYIFVWSEQHSVESLAGTEKVRISYVVEITGLQEDYADKIAVGDAPMDSSKKVPLGVITAVETRPYIYTGTNLHDGTKVLSTVEDHVSLYLTVETDAVPEGYGYAVSGSDMYVGRLLYLAFQDIVCSGYCIAMDVPS